MEKINKKKDFSKLLNMQYAFEGYSSFFFKKERKTTFTPLFLGK